VGLEGVLRPGQEVTARDQQADDVARAGEVLDLTVRAQVVDRLDPHRVEGRQVSLGEEMQ
jgi:hypothetical protein